MVGSLNPLRTSIKCVPNSAYMSKPTITPATYLLRLHLKQQSPLDMNMPLSLKERTKKIWEVLETDGAHKRDLLKVGLRQQESIRKHGGSFETEDIFGKKVSTDEYPKIHEQGGLVLQRGHFPTSRQFTILPGRPDGITPGDYFEEPTIILRPAQEIVAPNLMRMLPYPNGEHCGIWMALSSERLPKEKKVCCENIKTEHFSKLQEEWKKTKLCSILVQFLTENAHKMRFIDGVSIFALGALYDDQNFLQHVAAATIRDTIQAV
jgi:hypothetical protein